MALPVSELIDQALLDLLKTITEANGYNCNLIPQRPTRSPTPMTPKKYLALLYVGDDVPQSDGDGAGDGAIGQQTWRRPYGVLVYAMGSDGDTTPYDQTLNIARADIEKALQLDPGQTGLCRNTVLKAPIKIEDANEPVAVIVCFDVIYRHRWNDPYTQA